MRKENLITRTITSTTYDVMTVDVLTATVSTVQVTIAGSKMDFDKVLKKVNGWSELSGNKPVAITGATETTNLYGMTDKEFMLYAKVIKEGGR